MVENLTFRNGLRVVLVPIEGIRSVSIGIFMGVGSRYEAAHEAGAAHFIEHLLFKGTSRRPSAQIIAESIEGIGGLINAATDVEETTYWAKVAEPHALTALDVLTDILRHSTFSLENIEKERQVILEELKMYYDTPDDWVDVLLSQTLWPGHPLGKDIAGGEATVWQMAPQDLRDFYRRAYHPQNSVVVLAGQFDHQQIISTLQTQLEDWAAQPINPFQPAPGNEPENRFAVEDRPIEQGHLSLATPGLDRYHPGRYALSLLNTILGEGMSSRLFLKIREELGLAYAVGSGITLLADTGNMTIYAGVDPRRAKEALAALLAELDRLTQQPVKQTELNKAREFLKGRLILSLENSFSQASWYGRQRLFYDNWFSPEEILARYDALTPGDIQDIAQALFDPQKFVLAAVGPFQDGQALQTCLDGV